MLGELAVRDLGVIEELALQLGPGMTAVTGESGAGKSLILDAISLLTGGRADSGLVRPGADYAEVQGRFYVSPLARGADGSGRVSPVGAVAGEADGSEAGGGEIVVRRVVPSGGRSRCYVNGRMATLRTLQELCGSLVEMHGQGSHQKLLKPKAQRAALDRFGGIDTARLSALALEQVRIDRERAVLGGGERARIREIDLLRYQLDEINGAAIEGPGEDERLERAEAVLAEAAAHREAAFSALDVLRADGRVADGLSQATAALSGRPPFEGAVDRLLAAEAEIADAVAEIRIGVDAVDDDPAVLADLCERRQQLAELRRKYGSSLMDVIEFGDAAGRRLAELEDRDRQAAALDEQRAEVERAMSAERALVRGARAEAAPRLAVTVQSRLRELDMAEARLDVRVEGAAGEKVAFQLAANPGVEPMPLARVASGGELARVMMALRLVIGAGPPTLVFDEVDAGVGGAAARAVGSSLAAIAGQVLVVTHLAQVAAHAERHLVVEKSDSAAGPGRSSSVRSLSGGERVVEMSRMLSGSPGSSTARRHAEELLTAAARGRGRPVGGAVGRMMPR